jgi:hypothetical protein
MAKQKKNGTPQVDPVEEADIKAVMDHAFRGKPLDPEVRRRVEKRAEKIRRRILKEHGLVDIAVPAIRELRGELPEP